jgi:hypothetical protein
VAKQTLTPELALLHERRKIFFLDDLNSRRKQTRVDVYMGALKTFAGKQIYDLTDMDVLDFLIFKDVDNSGRTVVHFKACPFIGTDNFLRCENSVLCAKRHQSASMRTGIISKLRKGFEEVGRKGTYDPLTLHGDPTTSPLIASYITFIRTEQGLSGVLPKSAATMERAKMDRFMKTMENDIHGYRGVRKLRMKQRRAIYAFCFTAIKRLAGAGHVIAPNTIRIPGDTGLVFNCTWDKTLRMGVHCFGFLCVKDKKFGWCAHCIIDEYVAFARTFKISFNEGLLFPRLHSDGSVKPGKRWTAKVVLGSLVTDLKRCNLYQGETAQSFRHGGTVDSLQTGKSLERTMYLAYMKNVSTAKIYAKGLSVLFPKLDWSSLGVDVAATDNVTLALQMQAWRAFSSEGLPL